MKIDKIDNKLIAGLLDNCRDSNIRLGKKVGLSREGIANRIKRLEKEGVIGGYGININFSKLGYMPHEISIKLQKLDSKNEERILKFFRGEKKIIFVEKTLGKFDFVIMLMVKSLAELDEEIEKLRVVLGNHLKEISIGAWIANYDSVSSLFTNNPEIKISRHSANELVYTLDSKEKKLLKELALNSRESAVKLSKKIGVSEITLANKIKLLLNNKVIKGFRASINFEKLGIGRYAILLNVSSNQIEDKLAEFCKNHRLIADFTKFIGEYNYSIEVFALNNLEFKHVVSDLLNAFSDEVISYDTLILLEEIKHMPFYE